MYFFFILAALLVIISAQPLLVFCSLALLYIIYRLFWTDGVPKVLFIGLIYFWLSITAKIFYADFTGLNYENLSSSPLIIETTYVALLCLGVFAVGLHLTSKNVLRKVYVSYTETFGYNVNKVIIFYVIMAIGSGLLAGILFVYPAFSQLFNALILIKMGLLFLLIHTVYAQKKSMWVIVAIVGFEVILSFVSFFSSFKDILITVAIVFSFYPIKISAKQYIGNIVLAFGIIYLLLIWQTIKGDYRSFLNKGTNTQTVQVTTQEALREIQDLAAKATPFDRNSNVIYSTIDRLSNIEFFSQAMSRVPKDIPYTEGKLWLNNITHVLTPRILNPDKEAIDDSKMVNQYCTQKVATAAQGASFSLGFLAESYIDFGPYLMYIPVFLIGCLFGFIYTLLISKSINFVWGFSMVSPLWVYIGCNGIPGTKILGWILMYLIAFYIIKRFFMKPIDKFLRGVSTI